MSNTMKEDQSSVYMDNPNFKPPDRSTSAPPVLSLHSESLFAFRAAEHLQLFSDIRCEDNYEFYSKYQNHGGKGSLPPLENQPFMIDRTYGDEDDHILNSLPSHVSSQQQQQSHQQQIQQLQQQIQQQHQQIQHHKQMQQYQQYLHQQQLGQQQQQQQQQHPQLHPMQHSYPQHQMPSQHQHHSHSQHMNPQQQVHQQQVHQQHMMPQQHIQQQQQQQQQHLQHQHPQHLLHQPHPQQFPQNRYPNDTHRNSAPNIHYNPLPRSTSNPTSYRTAHPFDHEEQQSRIQDDLEPSNEIWGPLPLARGAPGLIDDYLNHADDVGIKPQHSRGGGHHVPPHHTPPLQQPTSRGEYYPPDFDNVALRSAHQLLDDNISSIWSDRGFDGRQNQPQRGSYKQQGQHIAAPSPTVASQSSLLNILNNGGFLSNDVPTADKVLSNRRRASSGGRSMPSVVPTTSPPPYLGSGSASTSPALPICRYYAQGFCSRGERCNFLHDEQSQQALSALQQDVPFSITKPKAKKTVASPPPISMSNLPPKVPSPVNMRLPQTSPNAHMGNGHPNGTNSGPTTPNSNVTLGNIIASLSGMNLERNGSSSGRMSPTNNNGMLDMGGSGGTSPQPIPRSTTPTANGDMFGNSGSTSPNGKSDLTRQYTSIEQVIGHIYSLCKDQHGCRFLQKKLEDRDPLIVEIIFNEVYDHMTELMIDPFGNYLCQKLLEHCNDAQRLEIIEKVAPDLVKISKNMHGTRAVQKMIEYLTTPDQPAQIAIAKKALSNHVVTLIQDLNGNHVIQRCLNRLSPQDNQFIYDSVSQAGHCVEVATHRHGCCVLQRCIDHASDSQKIQLINEIIANALVLVQDPYGNYVVQYVLDLPFPGFASRLARRFLGHIPILSTQKFSSNVVEKCLNVTDVQTRAAIIQELVEYDNLLYLLQDPYANYVIQTSLNVSEPVQHARLVEAIRPHLTSLRNTPYGKRIQNKILKESSRDYYA